jgi:hypothetical protein
LSAGWYLIDFARSRKTASLGNPARIPVSLSGCRYNLSPIENHQGGTSYEEACQDQAGHLSIGNDHSTATTFARVNRTCPGQIAPEIDSRFISITEHVFCTVARRRSAAVFDALPEFV